ncbi:uncharacterized protein LOC114274797 [Camellia sinensis]|uniref:uncharacterized protein LOC114274797 n=1 Tax=Camellia sinensis TaxID=4442 RepID=UPI001036C3D8|nr:uncharacterized protein LOC114274797 [Camellia sinensis]
MEIVNQMNSYGERVEQKRIVEKILRSLPEKYNTMVGIIEETKDISKMSVQELIVMENHQVMNKQEGNHQEVVDKEEEEVDEEIHQGVIEETKDISKMSVQELMGSLKAHEQSHGESSSNEQTRGESSRGGRQGRGRDLEENLLSVEQLVEHGYAVHFEANSCTIHDRNAKQVVEKIPMENNRSFPLTFNYARNVSLKAHTNDESWLWHRRLGHLNFHSLKVLHQKNMVQGLPSIEEIHDVCEGCALGKHHRQPFPKGVAWRAKEM